MTPHVALMGPMLSEGHQQRAEMALLRFVEAVEERLGRAGDRLEIRRILRAGPE